MLLFGKGMMYRFETLHYDLVQIFNYKVLIDEYTQESSDFYILNFTVWNCRYFTINHKLFVLPYLKMNEYNIHHVLILNAFIISISLFSCTITNLYDFC